MSPHDRLDALVSPIAHRVSDNEVGSFLVGLGQSDFYPLPCTLRALAVMRL